MRITLSIPNPIAERFRIVVPQRQRSRLVAKLLERELVKHDDAMTASCRAANRDRALEKEIDDWQSFDDGVEE